LNRQDAKVAKERKRGGREEERKRGGREEERKSEEGDNFKMKSFN
jgi:hypothetical protein